MPIGEVELPGMYCLSVGFVGAGVNWVMDDVLIRGFTRVIIFSFVGIVAGIMTIISYLKTDMRSVFTYLIYAMFGLIYGNSTDEHSITGNIRGQGEAIMICMITLSFVTFGFTAMFIVDKKTPIENIVMEAIFCIFCSTMSVAGTIDALSPTRNTIAWIAVGVVSIILGLWAFYIGLAHDVFLHMGKDTLYIKRGGVKLKAIENSDGKAPSKPGDVKTTSSNKETTETKGKRSHHHRHHHLLQKILKDMSTLQLISLSIVYGEFSRFGINIIILKLTIFKK
eukprot:gnl/Chilomastix_caulleri/394.p1 GENE.gnl/Chilomastix_caulleri/394~~gnl/Chilomastix_caulleri/394.p1  ORF type:complete len:281 (-),score=34.30 gnl/Chilomastix_caulleri/394:123-965(-)